MADRLRPSRIGFKAIGVIHTPFDRLEGMPIQPAGAAGVEGRVEVFPRYGPGLRDLDGFSHVILIYHLHMSRGYDLEVVPYMDTELRGLFSTRAPRRPNPIGLSIVELSRVDGCALHVRNVDMLDGTPLLDIKPYVPGFDEAGGVRTGWLEKTARRASRQCSDGRFA
ncbi:tRNA (N6-threonylcarbamoyladenosine(37)-N6)-methyltransferase TrmO [Candidatus Fermentibacterales bacterium]|nr:tRNA (N6-threonylcarbamoyladenosine(37)-N6)-methyltransferase TrmO [Candidatus Fermentibacterales bacterium]